MQIIRKTIDTNEGTPHPYLLMSDLHVESPNSDHARIKEDLDQGRRFGCRIILNGDIFDSIGVGDKRYQPNVVRREMQGKIDQTKASIELAMKLLEPYADLIDIIGIGNHEETWINRKSTDPVGLLIQSLNTSLATQGSAHRILHGGITGYLVTSFRFVECAGKPGGKPPSALHKLLYMHGSGGDAPVTKGTINIARKNTSFNYDAFTFGHIHNSLIVDDVMVDVSTCGNIVRRQRICVVTGSYYRNYTATSQDDPASYSYAESKQHPEKPLGGKFLILTPLRVRAASKTSKGKTQRWVVKQDVMTSLSRLPKPVAMILPPTTALPATEASSAQPPEHSRTATTKACATT